MKHIGIIGCGAVTEEFYVRTLPKINNAKVKYVYDIYEKAAHRIADKLLCKVTDSNTLIKESDTIIIATPPHTHFDLLMDSMQRGKMIVCEKPFLLNSREFQHIESKNETVQSSIFVAHFRRKYPSVELAKNFISLNVLGNINEIVAHEGGRFNWGVQSDYFAKNQYGGVLPDTGSHTLDMAIYISGLDEEQINIRVDDIWRNSTEPSHELKSQFTVLRNAKNDITCRISLSRKQILSNCIRFIFEKGEIIVPVFPANYVSVRANGKYTTLYSADAPGKNLDVFQRQYESIFYNQNHNIFEYKRFKNLTLILERLLKA